jgi:predicted amidohydrolase YtcJ
MKESRLKFESAMISAAMLGILALAACGESTGPAGGEAGAPDIIYTNAVVYTMDSALPLAQALAISGERITAVGDAAEVTRLASDGTEVVDLRGKVVFPGFLDLHVHPTFGGMMDLLCKIPQGSSLASLQNIVRGCAEHTATGAWVTGGQWDASALGRIPDRGMIDAVAADVPVLLNDTSGHSALANSRALQIAGITRETPDPEGGIIERDADGEPTGVLRETATGLVRSHVPPPTDAMLRKALTTALEEMLASGITSFSEASAGFIAGGKREVELFTRLADEGLLKQRARVCMVWGDVDYPGFEELYARRSQLERERLALDCVKVYLDGVPTDSHTAAMLEPYVDTVEGRDDEASRYGLLLVDQDELNQAVTRFDSDGMTVKFHAAGDAAVRAGLDAIAAAREANGNSGLHHNTGHVTFIAPEDIRRAKALDATLELSPYLWSPSPINDDITRAIGAARIKRVWPFREILEAGVRTVAGSDWAVVPSVYPWIAIEALVTRGEAGGGDRYFGREQAISVEQALELFTVKGADHMGKADELGRIKPGFLADLVVIDRDPYQVPATELHTVTVKRTVIAGETVYEAPER